MKHGKIVCKNCKAQFYSTNKTLCGICGKPFCPNCNACSCTTISISEIKKPKHLVSLKELNQVSENQLLEISAVLSPLIGQSPVSTKEGMLLKTEFEISEEQVKIPLIIWGPVPEKLFPFRYEFTNLTISGLKKKSFNGKTTLIASKGTKYYLNNLRTRSLDYFISQSIV